MTTTYTYEPAHDPANEPVWAGPLNPCAPGPTGRCRVRSELIDVIGALRLELQAALDREQQLRAQLQAQPAP